MKILISFLIGISISMSAIAEQVIVNHDLQVSYQPSSSLLEVTNTITLPSVMQKESFEFTLHQNLVVSSNQTSVRLEKIKNNVTGLDKGMDQEKFDGVSAVPLTLYKLTLAKGIKTFTLKYQGKINHTIAQQGEEYARGFSQSPGLIEKRGAYLAGSTYWIPSFADEYVTYSLTVESPKGWRVVSQGKRTGMIDKKNSHVDTWLVDTPTEEIYLIGAKFTEYEFDVGAVKAMAFLRSPDEAMATKYLETTAQYMEMYRNLLGPYPYSKFALIENFWETGYGMPSFTLLGEKIIRFPFILHSLYPHELLHNWWGNSVYIDFDGGNWCEGLTAYMADHLIAEQRGKGADYRRSTLQGFTDYVDEKSDFSLANFISRNSPASSAIGYGKSAMMWNMLRNLVGDDNFIKGFQVFYRDFKFKRASFGDIRVVFEQVSGKNLVDFFDQWLNRKGAPELRLAEAKVQPVNGQYQLTVTVEQVQKSPAFSLELPLAIYSENEVVVHKVTMNKKQQNYTLMLDKEPLKIAVDPQFNLFRKLHYTEIPPSLSKALGAEKVTLILPSQASNDEKRRYEILANSWAKEGSRFTVIKDNELDELPSDSAVWIMGWNNRFRTIIEESLSDYNSKINHSSVTLGLSKLEKEKSSIVIAVRHPKNKNLAAVWLTIHDEKAAKGLARKLPHYGKYSYLGFSGEEPSNMAKGQWPTVNSPLIKVLSTKKINASTVLNKRSALATLTPLFKAKRMQNHIAVLANDALKGRGLNTLEIDKAADYIAEQFKKSGLQPAGDETINGTSYFQQFTASAGKEKRLIKAKNIVAVLPGTNPNWAEESVIISAHYDHLGLGWPHANKGNKGKIHNGADDNASGVAVLLELAETMKKLKPQRSIIFVAFSGEEAGFLGAKHYVEQYLTYPAKKAIGIINLDTVGRLAENKLLILNSDSAREWKFILMGTSFVTGVTTEMVSQDIGASDQIVFIEHGIPGIHLFSGASPDYHKPTDTSEKIDLSGLVKVAMVSREVLSYLAEREEPMTFNNKNSDRSTSKHKKKSKNNTKRTDRKVTTGIMPDFAFSGKGLKVAAISDNSPASKAGIKVADILISSNGREITHLRSYSAMLKTHQIGDKLSVTFTRMVDGNKQQHHTIIILAER
jgi:hypothetical protein